MRKLLKVLGMYFLLLCVMTGVSTTVEAGELSTTYTLPSEALYEGQTYWIKVNVYGLNSGEKVESYQWKAIYDGFGGTQRLTLKDNNAYAGTQTDTFGFITGDDEGEVSQSTWDDSYGGFIGFYCEIKTTSGRKVSSSRVHIPHPLERTPVSLFLFTGVDAPMDGKTFDTTAESLADTVYTFNRLEWYNTDNDIAENKLSSYAVAVGGEKYCCRLYFDMLPAYEIDSGDVNCGFHDGDDKFLYDSVNKCYYIKAFYTALKPVCITSQPRNNSVAVDGVNSKILSFSFSAQNFTSYNWQIMEVIAGKNGHGRKVYTNLTSEKIEQLKGKGINISIDSRGVLYVTSSEIDSYYFRCVVHGADGSTDTSSVAKAYFYAMDGWYRDGEDNYYYRNGAPVTGFYEINDIWYYFEEDGKLFGVTNYPIVIVDQTGDQNVKLGEKVSFMVKTTLEGFSYQWQYSYDKEEWKNSKLDSARTDTYAFTASQYDNNMYVRCIVANECGKVISDVALLKVGDAPSISMQPLSLSVGKGSVASFEVKASGTGITYQWQYSYDKSSWNNSSISSATTSKYTFTASSYDNNMYARCLVSNSYGTTISDVVKLTVYEAPIITSQPKTLSVGKGSVATFEVKASGTGITYQWQYSYDKSSWKNSGLNSAKTSQYTFTASSYDNNMYARCLVSNSYGTAISDAVKLTVYEASIITSQPKSLTVRKGDVATFEVKASGTGITYQWQYSYDKSNWNNSSKSSAKTSKYIFTASSYDNNMYARCLVKNASGTYTSDVVKLTVAEIPYIISQPKSLTVNKGSVAVFEVKATGSGLSYQWQYSYDKNTWKDSSLSVAKTSKYEFTASVYDNNMYARCFVKNSYGTVVSTVVKLEVK